jgi:hypothetical protein
MPDGRLLPGGAIQFPGGPFIPLWTSAFHGALKSPDYINHRIELRWLSEADWGTDEDRDRSLPDVTEQQGKGHESRDPHQRPPQY